MTDEERAKCCDILATAIREASVSGKLIGKDRLEHILADSGIADLDDGQDASLDSLIAQMLAAHPDLAVLSSVSGQALYHDTTLLSRTYAAILDRKGSPVILIAEEVRKNSAEYPRTLPVDLFEQPPFDLRVEEIEASLKSMAVHPEYQDISMTITSTGSAHLFSSRYLERSYAAFLAERADTGLLLNP